jgi:hypothetical protein
MRILNRWGNTIVILNKNKPTWEGENYSDGVYYYLFQSKNKAIFKQGFFQLIR